MAGLLAAMTAASDGQEEPTTGEKEPSLELAATSFTAGTDGGGGFVSTTALFVSSPSAGVDVGFLFTPVPAVTAGKVSTSVLSMTSSAAGTDDSLSSAGMPWLATVCTVLISSARNGVEQ